jgi:hypothetical protein
MLCTSAVLNGLLLRGESATVKRTHDGRSRHGQS